MALTKITSRILDSSGVTTVGTISTGVWQGTAINQTYLVGQSGTNTGDETLARINALDITELGTISSGVWNGTAIASAYLDADTAHLSTTQTFTGAKSFGTDISVTGMATIVVSDISTGENKGLKLENTGGSGKTWHITPGTTGVNNSNFTIRNSSDNINVLTITSGGDVTLNGNSTTSALLFGQSSYARIINTSGQTLYVDSDVHEFRTNGGVGKLTILSDGKVGVGTTSPDQKLHISGTIHQSDGTADTYFGLGSDNDNYISTNGGFTRFRNGGTTQLNIAANGDATFSGNIALTGSASNLNFSADQDGSITMSQRNDGGRNLDIGAGGAGSGGGTNSNGGNLTLRSGGTKGTGTSTMHFRTSVAGNGYGLSTEQMKIDAVGDVSITNNLFIGSGKALYVGGTAAANALDDYEEGTFSPFVQKNDSGGSGIFSSGSQSRYGRYVRVGKKVAIWIYVYISTANAPSTSGGTTWMIMGLPYTFRGAQPYQFLPAGYSMISSTVLEKHVRLQINNNADYGFLYGRTTLDSTENNGTAIEFSFSGVLEIN